MTDPLLRLGIGAAAAPPIALLVTLAVRALESRLHRWRSSLHARRLRARLARGEDRYFEELRALESYPPEPTPKRSFLADYLNILVAVILALVGASLLRLIGWFDA